MTPTLRLAGPLPDGVVLPAFSWGVVALSIIPILDLLRTRELLPEFELPDPGVTPRPPEARTFLPVPGLTILLAGARELLRLALGLAAPGDFLMVGPFLWGLVMVTSCSART